MFVYYRVKVVLSQSLIIRQTTSFTGKKDFKLINSFVNFPVSKLKKFRNTGNNYVEAIKEINSKSRSVISSKF